MTSVHEFEARSIDGEPVQLRDYSGKVLLIVNVASRCGYTPQYTGLEALYRKHRDEGLVVLGFPCNQFGQQEPGTSDEIKSFCSLTYDVTFPIFQKIDVNGAGAHPLFQFLCTEAGELEPIAWNFTKFLVDRSGKIIGRFEPSKTPEALEPMIATALA